MKAPTRRKFVGLLGGTLTVSLAGCVADDAQQGEFVIVATRLQQHPESDRDVQVRIEVENRRSQSQPALLTAELERTPDEGESKTWTKERELEIPKGSGPQYFFRFENAVTGEFDRDEFTAEAELKER